MHFIRPGGDEYKHGYQWCAHGGRGGGGTEEDEAHWVWTVTTSSAIAGNVDRCSLQLVLSAMDCTTLFIGGSVCDAHYMGFCKQVLWQAFHHVDLLDMRHPAFDDIDIDIRVKQKSLHQRRRHLKKNSLQVQAVACAALHPLGCTNQSECLLLVA